MKQFWRTESSNSSKWHILRIVCAILKELLPFKLVHSVHKMIDLAGQFKQMKSALSVNLKKREANCAGILTPDGRFVKRKSAWFGKSVAVLTIWRKLPSQSKFEKKNQNQGRLFSVELPPSWFVIASATWGECEKYFSRLSFPALAPLVSFALSPGFARHYKPRWRQFDQSIRSRHHSLGAGGH